MFDALDIFRAAINEHDLSEAEYALRWTAHHSQLKNKRGHAIIIGASSINQLEENLKKLRIGPLPANIVEAFDRGWEKTRPTSWWH